MAFLVLILVVVVVLILVVVALVAVAFHRVYELNFLISSALLRVCLSVSLFVCVCVNLNASN